MKWKRAIWIGVVAYFASMILGLVVNSMMGFEINNPNTLPASMWVVSLVVLFAVGMGAGLWYFQGKHTHPCSLHGLMLGVVIVMVGFVFDMLTVALFYVGSDVPAGFDLWDMYSQWWFWISIGMMLATTTLVGWYSKKHIS